MHSLSSTGISIFAAELEGRNVVIWSDNKGAEGTIRKGTLPHICVIPIASVSVLLDRLLEIVRP